MIELIIPVFIISTLSKKVMAIPLKTLPQNFGESFAEEKQTKLAWVLGLGPLDGGSLHASSCGGFLLIQPRRAQSLITLDHSKSNC